MENVEIRDLIKKVRKPFLYSLLFALLFIFVFFPTEDLGDLVSSKVSEATENKVFLQFGNFGIDVFPPGIEFQEVFLETAFSPGISAEEFFIHPSIGGLISQKPYGKVGARGFLNGDLNVEVKKGQSTETGNERQRVLIDAEKLSLSSLREMLKLSLALEGSASFTADAQADVTLNEQPEIDLNMDVEKFSLPPATMNTMMGPLTLPDMKLSSIHFKGRLSNGRLNIENGEIGKKQDDLFGTVKGFWNINLMMIGGRPVPQMGSYDLEINVTANKNFQAKAGLFLSLIDQYKTSSPEGSRYHFKVSAADLMSPPSITAP